MKKESTIGETLTYLALCLIMIVPSILWSGYVLTILWGWFVTPVTGVAVPSLAMAIGFATVISYMTHQHIREPEETRDALTIFASAVSIAFCRPAAALLVGYIVHCYV